MKKVGVVIPIYNVEKYLKECLDSVINQTYTNLEIILVNDGSTDENSLNIAKEYTLKDKRIILFDKKNGGLSSARNVGIEYFSGEYETQYIEKENELNVFKIIGDNPQNIYKIYKYKNALASDKLEISKIDYIIFLDSDNYWELNCIEECVVRMQNVDVLWFDHACIYDDGIEDKGQKTRMNVFNFTQECTITPRDYAKQAIKVGSRDISFSWGGMIDFSFLKQLKLKFINKIINEDIHFGMVLFASADSIYILPKRLYLCRLRANSISNHDKKVTKANVSEYFKDLYEFFGENAKEAKNYLKAASRMITALELIEFFKDQKNENSQAIKEAFLPFYVKKALMIKKFKKDPLNLKEKLPIIKPFIQTKIPYDLWKIWQKIKGILDKINFAK
ncbi:glycosyltransferase family 2 protein [Campylobacter jejuni]|uniref:Glycosyltransferase n=51 Tax=Campylobacteraceae TaxID=72294 RepID=Q0P9B8_CAMJE|nr:MULTISPECIES: glycosyltransferase family 2 protein [Campylobacter]YP_002344529.1 glycosyltransferase [Campylobacter jejuni subsp. jejuni NCTC 11168 = ATCC 700819]APA81381.1 Beta-1,3-galactosyltransferase / Beta-1,4-galactosyltransferase [Campylobacter jejuni subsp. jejuni D42a]EAI3655540.1 glycosyltransferase family 2 protein [Campylobacter fetus]EAJ1964558.1 glycosyltransferase family 2 protein [Campylobacter coli]EFV05938.1 glycosyl transferase family 2 family protein [Campylobacter jejun